MLRCVDDAHKCADAFGSCLTNPNADSQLRDLTLHAVRKRHGPYTRIAPSAAGAAAPGWRAAPWRPPRQRGCAPWPAAPPPGPAARTAAPRPTPTPPCCAAGGGHVMRHSADWLPLPSCWKTPLHALCSCRCSSHAGFSMHSDDRHVATQAAQLDEMLLNCCTRAE